MALSGCLGALGGVKAHRMELKGDLESELSTPVGRLSSLSIRWEMALEKGDSDILSNKIITEAGVWLKPASTNTGEKPESGLKICVRLRHCASIQCLYIPFAAIGSFKGELLR